MALGDLSRGVTDIFHFKKIMLFVKHNDTLPVSNDSKKKEFWFILLQLLSY